MKQGAVVSIAVTLLLAVLTINQPVVAQQWTALPISGTVLAGTFPPNVGWNHITVTGNGTALLYARRYGCGDPFSNAVWNYNIAANTFNIVWWSGGGNQVSGNCVQPVVYPNPPGLPGDRHPYHQTAFDRNRQTFVIVDGVEDYYVCGSTSVRGICTYQDAWTCDLYGNCAPLPTPPTKSVQGLVVWSGPTDDKYYFFPGLVGGSNFTGKILVLDPNNLSQGWVAKTYTSGPPPRNGQAGVWLESQGAIFYYGGQGNGGIWLNDSWLYFPATNTWQALHPTVFPPASREASYFPRLAADTTRNRATLFTPTCYQICGAEHVFGFDFTLMNWVDLHITGGPQFAESSPPNSYPLANSMSWDYDAGSDSFIVWNPVSGTAPKVWSLSLN